MNLYLRLIKVLFLAWWRPRIKDIQDISRLTFRVWPNDLDFNLHMNNGCYFTLMDLGRTDLLLRAGLFGYLKNQKAAPVLGAATMRFRKPLRFWQKYTLESRVLCWNERWFYIEQRFRFAAGKHKGRIAAIGLVKGGLYSRADQEMLPPADIVGEMESNINKTPPDMPAHVREWIKSEKALRDTARDKENGSTQQ